MSTTQVQTVHSWSEKAKLAAAALFCVLGLVAFYVLRQQGVWVQWLGLMLCVAVAVVIFFRADQGKTLVAFGHDAIVEVKKVVWPSRKEAIQMTAYVFGFVLIMAVFLWLTDKTLEWLFYDLILGWKK